MLEVVGRYLLGLAALFAEFVAKLRLFGEQLLDAAAVTPWPYGWAGVRPDEA
jgi:hypothetical protein